MDKATWQQKAEAQLGRPIERLDYTPLPEVRVPALVTTAPPSSRGAEIGLGWTIGASYEGVPEDVAAAVTDDLEGGVEALCVDVRPFRGAKDLAQIVQPIDLESVHLGLANGSIGDAAALVGVIHGLRRSTAPLALDFGLDPIGLLTREGYLTGSLEGHLDAGADLARWCRDEAPRARVFAADDATWHDRGADEAWSIALTVASALAYVRAMEAAGIPLEDAMESVELRQSVPGRFLLGVAKLRATRRIVARIVEIAQTRGAWRQTTRPAWRERCLRDPAVNILRSTASTFGAIVGGADRILVPPHVDTAEARRLARNTQLILRDESHLGGVADPAGGAYALECLTDQLAMRAWDCLQQLEREGGIGAALTNGFVKATLKSCRERDELLVRTRKHPLLGVSRFPDPAEPPITSGFEEENPTSVPGDLPPCDTFEALLPDALSSHSSELTTARVGTGVVRVPTLDARRLAEPFEALRAREPRSVYLASLGSLREHNARTAFGRELLTTGGFTVETAPEATDPASIAARQRVLGSRVVLLSMADSRFDTDGVEAVRLLVEQGTSVWMLGRPDEALGSTYESLGARGWIASGSDVLSALLQLWEHA